MFSPPLRKKIPKYFIENWGQRPLCNENPDAAPHIKNFCFPLCWRCTSLIGSILISYLILQLLHQSAVLPVWISILLVLPTGIDGTLQYFFGIPSTNIRRLVTGIIGGFGIVNIVFHIPPLF